MEIERTDQEMVVTVRIPSTVSFEETQRMLDLIMCKEAIAHSQATQEDIDTLARKVQKGWWAANRHRFIKSK
jgi:hypothetical protein